MDFNLDFSTYFLWSLYGTIAFLLLSILGLIFKWGFRFRLVGATGFMGVLTIGLFGLSLALFERVEIEGAIRFNRVYDTGANQVVIAIPIDITPSQLEATLKQASIDLFSYGRTATDGDDKLTIRARAQLHKDGFTYPLYLGQIRRSLLQREDNQPEIAIFKEQFSRIKSLS